MANTNTVSTTTPPESELKRLGEAHEPILRMAISRDHGFRNQMPVGGQEAIDAGLVVERDPTWMMSDSYGACNGFSLTRLGQSVGNAMGWTCRCHGCRTQSRGRGWPPVLTNHEHCNNCQGSITQYGIEKFHGNPSCKMHVRILLRACENLEQYCITAAHLGMRIPPADCSPEQIRELMEVIHGLQTFVAIKRLDSASDALAELEREIIPSCEPEHALPMDECRRYSLWTHVGSIIGQHSSTNLTERMTAAGSNLEIRRAVDFLTNSTFAAPLPL